MTKGGRIFAGIFSIIGSGIELLLGLVLIFVGVGTLSTDPVVWIAVILFFVLGILGLVGGILNLTDKTAGGVLAIVAGTGGIIMVIGYWGYLGGVLGGSADVLGVIMPLFFIPPAMMLVAGIVAIAVGSEL